MRSVIFAASLIACVASLSRADDGKPPATQPAVESFHDSAAQKAAENFQAKLDALDAGYRVKKAQVLREYAGGLGNAQRHAMGQGDANEAQAIYDRAEAAMAEADRLDPPKLAPEANLTPFHVRLRDFDGAAGRTGVVEVTEKFVRFIAEDDFGHPPREIWRRDLRAAEQKSISAYMKSFPLDQLEDSYIDPNVLDGYDMDYIIQIGAGKERHIHVANIHKVQLEMLVAHVNGLLPPKCQLDAGGHSSVRPG